MGGGGQLKVEMNSLRSLFGLTVHVFVFVFIHRVLVTWYFKNRCANCFVFCFVVLFFCLFVFLPTFNCQKNKK